VFAPLAPKSVTLSSHTMSASSPVTLRFTVSQPGTVTLTLTTTVHGKTKVVGNVTIKVSKGKGSYKLGTRFDGHKLSKGSYQLSLQTTSGHSHSSAVREKLAVR
jgi:hypothetical protein